MPEAEQKLYGWGNAEDTIEYHRHWDGSQLGRDLRRYGLKWSDLKQEALKNP
jgi:hypothetical protein